MTIHDKTKQMTFRAARSEEFAGIRQFYWDLIDRMDGDAIGWKKGIYPSDAYLADSLQSGALYILEYGNVPAACVILNSEHNEGYDGLPWHTDCPDDAVLTPHALAVSPDFQGCGVGRLVVTHIFRLARAQGKRAIRLDILGTNRIAERLYTGMGFRFVAAKNMFYEDTGWTEYKMYDYDLEPR